jgi:hypothetical protein
MCRVRLITAVVFLFAAPLFAAPAERAIMVREANLYLNPDMSSQKIGDVGRGREVAIITKARDWLQVFANVDQERDVTGWILDKGVVRTSTPHGDEIIYGEAVDSEAEASRRHGRRGADKDSMRLYARMAEYFPNSALAAQAAYRGADIRWQIDVEDARTLPSSKERDPNLRPKIEEEYMRQVMKKFPGTKWADLAAFHLIENKLCGDWQGLPKCPEKEIEIYEKYAKERPNSPAAPEALYDAAWRSAALIEIYKANDELGKIAGTKQRAISLAQQIASSYPKTDWAARAERLAFLVEQGVPTYGSQVE